MTKICLLILPLFFLSCSHQGKIPAKQTSVVVQAWTAIGPNNSVIVRAVVNSPRCPDVITDQAPIAMKTRTIITSEFPYPVCEAQLPENVRNASVDEIALALPKNEIRRIVVLGDTGCRMKNGSFQDCHDSRQWPFAMVAESAARLRPDLVIHVGDYHYREAACPNGNKGCEGVATGYSFPAWNEDFLMPAATLLRTSPWIFVRGNHENCDRAGEGWVQMLDPRPFEKCTAKVANYKLAMGDHDLVVIDSGDEKNMKEALAEIRPATKNRKMWILVHRPFVTTNANAKMPSYSWLSKSLQKPGVVGLVLSGHIHYLSLNRFTDSRPPELIVGNGGTALDKDISFLLKHPNDNFYQYSDFGFISLDKIDASKWQLKVHDQFGSVVQNCTLLESLRKKSQVSCAPGEL